MSFQASFEQLCLESLNSEIPSHRQTLLLFKLLRYCLGPGAKGHRRVEAALSWPKRLFQGEQWVRSLRQSGQGLLGAKVQAKASQGWLRTNRWNISCHASQGDERVVIPSVRIKSCIELCSPPASHWDGSRASLVRLSVREAAFRSVPLSWIQQRWRGRLRELQLRRKSRVINFVNYVLLPSKSHPDVIHIWHVKVALEPSMCLSELHSSSCAWSPWIKKFLHIDKLSAFSKLLLYWLGQGLKADLFD